MRRTFLRVRKKAACTVPHLRVPWGKTAYSARQGSQNWRRGDLRVARQRNCVQRGQLREPCAGGLRLGLKAATSASLPFSPASQMAAPRQPNRSSVNHAPGICARSPKTAPSLSLPSSPAAHIAAPRQPNRSPPIATRKPRHPLTLMPSMSGRDMTGEQWPTLARILGALLLRLCTALLQSRLSTYANAML